MEIYTKNNHRYLKTLIKQDNYIINANELFEDLHTVVEIDSSNKVKIDRLHPAQKIINRFSGLYMSPTFLHGFNECQASQVYNSLMPYIPSDYTSIGKTTHSILQNFYNQKKEDRDLSTLDIIKDKLINENNQEKQRKAITIYIEGFKNTPDYLYPNKPMDHKSLDCFQEVFMNGNCSPLGVKLPLPIYCLSDRIDIRNEGIFVIDYKTGTRLKYGIETLNGYAPQMICYSWMIYEKYGEKPSGAYLLCPGTKEKIVKIDINSLKNQSIYIERIFKFRDDFLQSSKTKEYKEQKMQYCNYCKMKKFCNVFNNQKKNTNIQIDYDITLPEIKVV
jgi:hypothetical protein